jgi:hypothetical protein
LPRTTIHLRPSGWRPRRYDFPRFFIYK